MRMLLFVALLFLVPTANAGVARTTARVSGKVATTNFKAAKQAGKTTYKVVIHPVYKGTKWFVRKMW